MTTQQPHPPGNDDDMIDNGAVSIVLAVLVPADATTTTIDPYLDTLLRPLILDGIIGGYRLGGTATGAWDPDYVTEADEANWRTCLGCLGTGRTGTEPCRACRTAVAAGRRAGTYMLWNPADWARHAGDIVPLPRLLDLDWRFPAHRSPAAWIDGNGTSWLDAPAGPAAEPASPHLQQIFEDLLTGRRRPGAHRDPDAFEPDQWSVAVVEPAG